MKTEVILKRPFMGGLVEQKSKSGLFNATDLVRIGNIKRNELGRNAFNLSQYLKNKQTTEFIEELQKENEKVLTKGKGAGSKTWVHPLLFIDIALSINPSFKVNVYKWLFDELLKYRNDSGESYKKMAGALYERTSNKTRFHLEITETAKKIKEACNVSDWNTANENQLKLREKIHDNIYLLCNVLKDMNHAVDLGITYAKQTIAG